MEGLDRKALDTMKALRERSDGMCLYAADLIQEMRMEMREKEIEIERLKLKQKNAEPDRLTQDRATPEDRMRKEIFYRSVADNGEGVADE